MNIAFIGYRTSGKTTVSTLLAEKINCRRIETDKKIEEVLGLSIPDIVARFGWKAFRKTEENIIEHFSHFDNLILDLGGGAVLNKKGMLSVKNNSLIIFMDCPPEVILKRIQKSFYRPPLTTLSLEKEINQILTTRLPLYKKYADIVIRSDIFSAEKAADIINNYLISFGIRDYFNNHQRASMA
jgi:shikimate kinase